MRSMSQSPGARRLGLGATILQVSIAVVAAEDVSLSPPVFLPDGSEFLAWECRTAWTRTYVVDRMHPEASDDKPGTAERPFRTIGRAAEVLLPGERVVVKSGGPFADRFAGEVVLDHSPLPRSPAAPASRPSRPGAP